MIPQWLVLLFVCWSSWNTPTKALFHLRRNVLLFNTREFEFVKNPSSRRATIVHLVDDVARGFFVRKTFVRRISRAMHRTFFQQPQSRKQISRAQDRDRVIVWKSKGLNFLHSWPSSEHEPRWRVKLPEQPPHHSCPCLRASGLSLTNIMIAESESSKPREMSQQRQRKCL